MSLASLLGGRKGGGGSLADLLSPEVALPMAAAMMGGGSDMDNFGNALLMAGQGIGNVRKNRKLEAQRNETLDFLRQTAPEYAEWVDNGAIDATEAFKAYQADQRELKAQTKGSKIINAGDGQLYDPDSGEWITAPNAGNDDYAARRQAAEQYGLPEDHPAYQSFILTGKMPREDAQPLTATDKKAILEADEMVAANENAIVALDQAEKLSDQANSGWLAGTRAAAGNNLPDWMVPDAVSSPESSAATANMDNAVIGQALTSLKTIFGGAPTEGERKILLDLQGSSSMPREVRKDVFERAKALAARRLEFNRKRAEELRGGDFYKPAGQGGAQQPADDAGWQDMGDGVKIRALP